MDQGTNVDGSKQTVKATKGLRPSAKRKYQDEVYTTTRIYDMGRRLAAGLKSLGVGRGDHVVDSMPNSPEVFACELFRDIRTMWSWRSPSAPTAAGGFQEVTTTPCDSGICLKESACGLFRGIQTVSNASPSAPTVAGHFREAMTPRFDCGIF